LQRISLNFKSNTQMRKRILIGIFLSFISFIAFTQEINQVDANGKKQGSWKKYYPSNDGLFYEGQFKDDQPIGVFKHYYEEGSLKSITTYGPRVKSEVFYPNGQLMAIGNFKEQLKDSIWLYFDKSGWMSLKESYVKGKRQGPSTSYYPTGSIAVEQFFNEDLENGEFVQYYANGKKEAEGMQLSGNYNGDYIYYYNSGKKMYKGEFILGKRNGIWVFYNEDGSISSIIHYKNGTTVKEEPINGEFIRYFESGLPKSIYHYKDGKMDGPFVIYFDKGEKVLVPRIKQDSYEPDELEEVIEGQQIKQQGNYKNGLKVGEELFFDEEGKLLKKEMYSNQ